MNLPTPLPASPTLLPSLAPLLGRLFLGLALLAGGGTAAWLALSSDLRPGLSATDTAQTVPLGSARTLQATLITDRGELRVAALPIPADLAAQVQAHHRQANPVQLTARQQGTALSLETRLRVDPQAAPNTINLQPGGPQVEHQLAAQLRPGLPLDLTTRSAGGDQVLDLRHLALRSLRSTSRGGDQTVQLPRRAGQSVSLSSNSGNIALTAPAASLTSLNAESTFGDLQIHLAGAQSGPLTLSSQGGDIDAQLPRRVEATISTERGDLEITLPAGASGRLLLRNEQGSTHLNLPADTAFRLNLPELGLGQVRALGSRLPPGLTLVDGAYLSPTARAAGSKAALLDIEVATPAHAELALNLQPTVTNTTGEPQP